MIGCTLSAKTARCGSSPASGRDQWAYSRAPKM